jgi:CRISPR/Cas system-associated exonuclease Cas4 (RecB family)
MSLSASKITTYLQCPRKFRFRYVLRIPTPWKASALALGSAVHGALETFHEQRSRGASMTPESVAALYRIDLAAELVDEIKYKDGERSDDLAATGEQLVRLYVAANQNVQVQQAEVPFELLVADEVVLRGVFDALLSGDRLRELKTAARDYDEGTLAIHVQLSAYSWAYRQLFGNEPILEVVALLKLKHPRVATHEVTRTAAEDAWFVRLVVEVARGIAAKVFPPNPSWACAECEYSLNCRAVQYREST